MCIGAAGSLLREQELEIPEIISLPDIVIFFDEHSERNNMPVFNKKVSPNDTKY
jgi:hypothetical protein